MESQQNENMYLVGEEYNIKSYEGTKRKILDKAIKHEQANTLTKDSVEKGLQDVNDIKIDIRVDYIIHTAGVTGGSKQHVDFPVRTINTALNSTNRLLEFAAEQNCRGFLYTSSLEVYGNTGRG